MAINKKNVFAAFMMMSCAVTSFAAEPDQIQKEAQAPQFKIPATLKSLTFDPKTQLFEGDLIKDAEAIAGAFGAYYAGKIQDYKYKRLPEQDAIVKQLKADFEPVKEEFVELKNLQAQAEEAAQAGKQGPVFTDAQKQRLKALDAKRQELRFQEVVLAKINAKIEQIEYHYQNLSSLPTDLQDLLYVVLIKPELIYLYDTPIYFKGKKLPRFGKEFHFNNYVLQNLHFPVGVRQIDLGSKAKCAFHFIQSFFPEYERKWLSRDLGLIQVMDEHVNITDALKLPAVSNLISSSFSSDKISELQEALKESAKNEIDKFDDKMENLVKPIAEFYNNLITVIEELKS